MPIWLMFIPVMAIVQGIIILFVALGQWATGTYYAMKPVDGGHGGAIEITRAVAPRSDMRIEARLADGRVFTASFDAGSRRAIVRGGSYRHSRQNERPVVAVELYAGDGTMLACHFAHVDVAGADAGGCTTPEGQRFDLVARELVESAVTTPNG